MERVAVMAGATPGAYGDCAKEEATRPALPQRLAGRGRHGIKVRRVMTGNGSRHVSHLYPRRGARLGRAPYQDQALHATHQRRNALSQASIKEWTYQTSEEKTGRPGP